MKFFLVLFIAFITSCSNKSYVNLKLSDEVIIPKTYIVNKSKNKIIIDGNDNEWNNSLFTSNFIDIEGSKIPSQQTNVNTSINSFQLGEYQEIIRVSPLHPFCSLCITD